MAAPKDNKHNLVWTSDEITKFIDKVYDYVFFNDDCVTLIKATLKCGGYEQLLRYFKTLDLDIDFAPIKKAKDIIKNRIIENGLNSEYNPTMSIFILKNNHDMKDKSEVEQTKIKKIKGIKFDE